MVQRRRTPWSPERNGAPRRAPRIYLQLFGRETENALGQKLTFMATTALLVSLPKTFSLLMLALSSVAEYSP